MYAANGILSLPDAPDARGSTAVRDLITGFLTSTRVDSIQVTPDTIEVFGDVAYEWGSYHQVYRPEGKPAVREDGRYVMRWAREADGEWRISRFTNNSVHRSSGAIGRPGT
jgi:ketosteroid isomerase-like protein